MDKKTMLTCDEMVKKVVDTFIVGSDSKFLKKVEKTAKGGGIFNDIGTALATADDKYAFAVASPLFFFMKSKEVMFNDKESNIVYTMPKKEWPQFYQAIKNAISAELTK